MKVLILNNARKSISNTLPKIEPVKCKKSNKAKTIMLKAVILGNTKSIYKHNNLVKHTSDTSPKQIKMCVIYDKFSVHYTKRGKFTLHRN